MKKLPSGKSTEIIEKVLDQFKKGVGDPRKVLKMTKEASKELKNCHFRLRKLEKELLRLMEKSLG